MKLLRRPLPPGAALVFKLTLAGGLFVALLYYFRFENFLEALRDLDGYLVVLAALTVCVQIALAAGRWWLLLTGFGWRHVKFMESLAVNIVGSSFQYWTPGGVALDAVRILSSQRNTIPKKLLLFMTLLDRLLVVGAVALFALAFFLLRGVPPRLAEMHLPPYAWAIAVAIGTAAAGAAWLHLRRRQTPLPGSLRLSPVRLALAAGLALVTIGNFGLSAYLISRAMGLPSDPLLFLLLFPVAVLISSLPLTPGGFGVREISTVFILGAYLPADDAKLVLVSFLFGAISVLVTVPGALFFIFSRRHSVI